MAPEKDEGEEATPAVVAPTEHQVHDVAQTAGETLAYVRAHAEKVMEYLQSYEEEGTPLRDYIRMARERLTGQVSQVKGKVEGQTDNLVSRAKQLYVQSPIDMAKFNDFRRKHPEFCVGITTAAIFLPSMIIGTRSGLIRRTVTTAAGSFVVFYGANEAERRFGNRWAQKESSSDAEEPKSS